MPPTNEIALAVLFMIGVAMTMILLGQLIFYFLKFTLCAMIGHNWKTYLRWPNATAYLQCTRCGKGK